MVQHQAEHIEESKLVKSMVIDVMQKQRCRSVKDIVNTLQQLDRSITFEDIREAINDLKNETKITLSEQRVEGPFLGYITNFSGTASFWLTIIVAGLTLTTIYLTPQVVPWSMIRIGAGAAFVLFIPGYALIQILFPTKDMDTIERSALSVGLSLAVAPLVGLMLNYSPWGIRLDPIVTSLSALSIALAFGGIYKKFLLLNQNLA